MSTVIRADLANVQVGDTAECELEVTPSYIDAFADWSHDDNPLHMDDSVAGEYGFPGRVAHGMVAMGMLSRLIGTRLPGPGALWIGQEAHFVTAIAAGDRLRARVTVQSVSRAAQVVVSGHRGRQAGLGRRGAPRHRPCSHPAAIAENGNVKCKMQDGG